MKNYSQSGFTLFELIITLAMLAVLLGLAAPAVSEIRLNTRTTGLSNDLLLAMSLARGESVKLTRPVTITALAAGDWTGGWAVTQDIDGDGGVDTLLRNDGFDNFTLSAVDQSGTSVDSIAFSGLGQVVGGVRISFALNRDGGADDKGRMICVAANGQTEVRKGVTTLC